jgi:SAM-dependent methyltransferase
MNAAAGSRRPMSRYAHLGSIYDVISLEAVLYRRPRAQLAELFGPMRGATVVDVGCGTGLNLAWLRQAVSPGGHVVGIDPSHSMLARARRRSRRHRWTDVTLIEGDVDGLAGVLTAASIRPDGFVATFVLSVVPCDDGFWNVVDEMASRRAVRVGLAELGPARAAPAVLRVALDTLTSLGGGHRGRRPWQRLIARDADAIHETRLGGHVHVAVGAVHHGDP